MTREPRNRSRSRLLAQDPLERVLPANPPAAPEGTDMTTITPETAQDGPRLNHARGLEALSTPVMIADADGIVRFVNAAARALFAAVAGDIRPRDGAFAAEAMADRPFGEILNDVGGGTHPPLSAGDVGLHRITLGTRTLAYRACPLHDPDQAPAGTLIEWTDVTADPATTRALDLILHQIREMYEAHENGIIDRYMDATGLPPELAELADGVNAMVRGHIQTKRNILDCMKEFAQGNFDADVPRYTDQRVFINDAVDSVRASFRAIAGEVERFAQAIQDGALDIQLDAATLSGEYRAVIEAMDRALGKLNETFGAAKKQVSQVAVTVEQMANSSQSLATNSQIQSASVDEVSASAEQTSIQVKANASSADKAARLVAGTSAVASEGRQRISAMVQAMEGIQVSSQNIAKIIKVIDEIAFQTNLLALNAAVEAARAGQHGRGFAVVAQEVRNLAGRSAKAARETSDLIEDAANRVQSGVRIADETRAAFGKIADDVQEVQAIVREIASASEEQSRGVLQINGAIGEVAKTALATSQQADELAASAAEMQAATEAMQKEFNHYVLRPVAPPAPLSAALPLAAGLPNLASLPESIMDQVQRMIAAHMAKGAGGSGLNGAHRSNGFDADRDERGFSSF